ncbi:MAG: hypothetical protein DRI69_10080 [Bacteroidetes bacterium]|nr:MAG: hypothetical protein DRI69_10080 [Bacteroidota bacterium]
MTKMKKAASFRTGIRQIVKQGNQDEISELFKEIIEAAKDEFTEDNYQTMIAYLMSAFMDGVDQTRDPLVTHNLIRMALIREISFK